MADKSKEPEEVAGAKPSSIGKVLIPGFIATVIVVETLIFFFMVPTADDVAALAEARLIEKIETNMEADGEVIVEDEEAIKEFSMGQYEIIFTPPGSDRNHRVEFELFGKSKSADLDAAKALFEERKGRLKDKMLEEVRNASMNDLQQMALIRRRVFATSSEILAHDPPILQGVGFERYFVYEE
ncbi:MAG: hypothetical protein KDB22_07845 [Planctomycetales bacterium]|nr:hypothetical protein [Planctomycetales bacterium]